MRYTDELVERRDKHPRLLCHSRRACYAIGGPPLFPITRLSCCEVLPNTARTMMEILPLEDRSSIQRTSASFESRFRWLALIMDDLLRVPGTKRRFGLDPIIGLLPGIGDVTSAIVSAVAFVHAARCGVPKILLARIAMNILINELVGIIPGLAMRFRSGSSRTCATTNCSASTLPRLWDPEEAIGYSSSQFSVCCLSLCARV